MGYRTPLEARLAKHVTKAIVEYGLIEHGDRVMVGLSGGKDSWALLQILDVLRQRAPNRRLVDHAPTPVDAPADEVKFGALVTLRSR